MASRSLTKVSFNSVVESNSLSPDSLSFSGLICIRDDQSPKSPPISSRQTRTQDTDFEFSQTVYNPTNGVNQSKYKPADLLISNGKIISRDFEFQPKQRPEIKRSGGVSRAKDGLGRQKRGQRNQVVLKEHKSKSGSGFGSKLFKSFASPCRECKAIKPEAVKTKKNPRKV